MQFVPFWVIPRRLSSNCRRFGTHCRFHLHKPVNGVRNKLHLEHGESLKTRKYIYAVCTIY